MRSFVLALLLALVGFGRTAHADDSPPDATPAAPAPPPVPVPHHKVSARFQCTDCHIPGHWVPSTITPVLHADFGYALLGAHATIACIDCHADGAYAGTPTACNACHKDTRHHGGAGDKCEACHTEDAWKPVPQFDHARTGFAIDRGHARLGCVACHGGDGKRLQGKPAARACQSCHAPPHGNEFGTACTTCHTTGGFKPVPKFDHGATEFPLELRHAELPCLSCHDARVRPTANPACRSCHGDPHRGGTQVECRDCHRPDRWRIIRFDHDVTGYPLTGRHRVTRCTDCHRNEQFIGVRSDCFTCHAFDRPRTQDHLTLLACEDCHTTTSWRAVRK